jgi:DNA polymerase III delta subunit
MLYLFYGTDRNKALEKALVIIDKKLEEKKDAMIFKVDQENLTQDLLSELCGSQGLFEQKFIVHLKDVFQDELSKSVILKFLKDIKESENVFIWTEGSILKKDLTKIEKHTDKVWEHIAKEKLEVKENIFAITNYLLARDKKNLWIEFQNLRKVFATEEIHGTLFWAFKNVALVSKSKNAEDSGLKPFVYSNSKKALTKFSQEEVDEKFWTLTKILGDSRRGEGELDVLLEKWILSV